MKQIVHDIVLAAIMLLALLLVMGLMSDDDVEVLNQQALKDVQNMPRVTTA